MIAAPESIKANESEGMMTNNDRPDIEGLQRQAQELADARAELSATQPAECPDQSDPDLQLVTLTDTLETKQAAAMPSLLAYVARLEGYTRRVKAEIEAGLSVSTFEHWMRKDDGA